MKLDAQQKILALVFVFAFFIAIGVLAFINANPVDERGTQVLILATSTQMEDITPNGWWNSIPTDPSLPTLPEISVSTLTPTVTPIPSKTPTSTSTSSSVP